MARLPSAASLRRLPPMRGVHKELRGWRDLTEWGYATSGRLIASNSWRIASEGQNQLRRDVPAETRRSNSLLRGQATHEHFSIERSAVVTPVRTTVAPSEFLTRINALSLFSMRRARASARHQIARSSDSQASARHQIARSSGSVRTSAMAGASPCRTISNVNTGIQHRPFFGNGFPPGAVCAEIGPSVI